MHYCHRTYTVLIVPLPVVSHHSGVQRGWRFLGWQELHIRQAVFSRRQSGADNLSVLLLLQPVGSISSTEKVPPLSARSTIL